MRQELKRYNPRARNLPSRSDSEFGVQNMWSTDNWGYLNALITDDGIISMLNFLSVVIIL